MLIVASYASAANHHSDLGQSRQLLIVTTPDWHSVSGTIQRYERHGADEPWRKVGEPIAVVVGKGGMGWGDGVVAVPIHAATDPVKHEGDGRTPAGVFRVGTTFGYAQDKPAAWAMPYRLLTPATECVFLHVSDQDGLDLMPYTGLQFGVLGLRTVEEHLICSLKLLGFVPMHSDSQPCLIGCELIGFFHGDNTGSNPVGDAK